MPSLARLGWEQQPLRHDRLVLLHRPVLDRTVALSPVGLVVLRCCVPRFAAGVRLHDRTRRCYRWPCYAPLNMPMLKPVNDSTYVTKNPTTWIWPSVDDLPTASHRMPMASNTEIGISIGNRNLPCACA